MTPAAYLRIVLQADNVTKVQAQIAAVDTTSRRAADASDKLSRAQLAVDAAARRAASANDSLARAQLGVDASARRAADANSSLARAQAAVDATAGRSATANASLARAQAAVDVAARRTADANDRLALSQLAVAAAARRTADANGRLTQANTTLDHNSRTLNATTDKSNSTFSQFAKIIGKGGLITAVGGLGGAMLGAAPAVLGLGAAFGAASIGIGVLALGAKHLIGTAQNQGPLYKQWTADQKALTQSFGQAAQVLRGPLSQALSQLPKMIQQLTPAFRSMFAGAATLIQPLLKGFDQLAKVVMPQLGQMFRAVAPLIQPLISGLAQFMSGIIAGLLPLLHAVAPVIGALAATVGELGFAIGQVLKALAPAIGPSIGILQTLIAVLGVVLKVVAQVAGMCAKTLASAFSAVVNVLVALMPTIQLVAKVFAQLASTVLTALVHVLNALLPILSPIIKAFGQLAGTVLKVLANVIQALVPSFVILAKVIGQVFQILQRSGVFQTLASALKQVGPLLAQLIGALVKGLAPILPPVIKLLANLAQILVQLLVTGLKQLIPLFLSFLKQVLPPLIPLIKALVPVVTALARALAVGLVTAIRLLQPVIAWLLGALGTVARFLITTATSAVNGLVEAWNGLKTSAVTVFRVVRDAVFTGLDPVLGLFSSMLRAASSVFDVLSHLPGVGGMFGHLRDAATSAANGIDNLRQSLRNTVAQSDAAAAATAAALKYTQARKNVDTATRAIAANFTNLKLSTGNTNADLERNFTSTWDRLEALTTSKSAALRDSATKALDQMRTNAAGILTVMLGDFTTKMNSIQSVTGGHLNNVAGIASGDFKKFSQAVWKGMNAGWVSVSAGNKLIQSALDQMLSKFANSTISQAKLVAGSIPNVFGGQRGGLVQKAASGLLQIGRPGARGQDNVPLNLGGTPVVAAEGEQIAVINHHQQGFLNSLLAPLGGLPGFFQRFNRPHAMAGGGLVGQRMATGGLPAALAKANWISSQHYPYVWGGGHNSTFTGPYDCSGAVSAVLHAGGWLSAPEVSGQLASFGAPGPGPITVFANTVHTFMSLLGRFFGTHGASGASWYAGSPLPGFTVRHPSGPGLSLSIPTPKVTGGGNIGRVAQGELDQVSKAVNAYLLTKIQTVPSAPGPGGPAGYTIPALESFWTSAGGPSTAARIAAAIAMAESGGRNVMQQGQPPGLTGWGLWQITPTSGIPGGSYLLNPSTNAQKAVQLYNQAGGFSPWVTFNDGAYQQFMARGGLIDRANRTLPFAGSFAGGGMVPGPLGAPAMAVVHGGETVSSNSTGPLLNIENMNVTPDFDERVLAHKLAFLLDM